MSAARLAAERLFADVDAPRDKPAPAPTVHIQKRRTPVLPDGDVTHTPAQQADLPLDMELSASRAVAVIAADPADDAARRAPRIFVVGTRAQRGDTAAPSHADAAATPPAEPPQAPVQVPAAEMPAAEMLAAVTAPAPPPPAATDAPPPETTTPPTRHRLQRRRKNPLKAPTLIRHLVFENEPAAQTAAPFAAPAASEPMLGIKFYRDLDARLAEVARVLEVAEWGRTFDPAPADPIPAGGLRRLQLAG